MSTTSEGFKLTTAQIVSSIFGYCGLGVAIACFVPLILSNAANRRNGTGGLFLALWVLGDAVNIPGVILLKAPLSQWFLAIWYALADICLAIELWKWGHPGPLCPDPTPAKTLLDKREMERKHKWVRDFDLQFKDWSFWDNTKLVMSCIFLGLGWWGIYVVASLYTKHDFVIEIPLSHDPLSLGFGIAATLAFTVARLPEYFEGRQRHRNGEKPTQELSDGVFIFLILENIFNLLSILVLATDPSLREDNLWQTYLVGEIPWIAGGLIPIVFDALLVFSIYTWQRAWNKKPFPHKEDAEKRSLLHALETDLDRNRLARQHLEEQIENVEIRNEAELEQEQFKVKREKEKEQKGVRKGVRKGLSKIKTAVGISEPEKSPVYADYEKHQTLLHHKYPTHASEALQRYNAEHGLHPQHHLSDHYSSDDGGYSSTSPTRPRIGSTGGNAPLLHSLSHSRSDSSSSSFSIRKSRSRPSSRYFGV